MMRPSIRSAIGAANGLIFTPEASGPTDPRYRFFLNFPLLTAVLLGLTPLCAASGQQADPAAPTNLTYPQKSIAAIAGHAIMPDIPTVTGTVSSFRIHPAPPPGLTLSASTGTISGTPLAAAPETTYTVTAKNAGGITTASVTFSVLHAEKTLLELGHANGIVDLRFKADRMLSADLLGHWALWNYATGAILANGDGTVPGQPPSDGYLKTIDMAGQTVAIAVTNGLEIRAMSDGHLLSIIPYPGLNLYEPPTGIPLSWWQLATDGSYICIGSQAGLFLYSPAGRLVWSKPGNYFAANVFAAPGKVQVALGPKGANVVQTISAVNGTGGIGPKFHGQFNSWFLGGGRFLTNLSNTVWVYSNGGMQQSIVYLPTVENLTCQGNWILTYAANTPGYALDIYRVGSNIPELSAVGGPDSVVTPSGNTIGVLAYGAGQASVIDLSGSTPKEADYNNIPVAYLSAYAAVSDSQWVVGNGAGVLVEGASLSSTPRFFGLGTTWSIAGSSGRAAIGTSTGKTLVFDNSTWALENDIDFPAGKLALSSDGKVLGASTNAAYYQYEPDRTLNFYSLPSGNVISSFPYALELSPAATDLFDFTLAGSGATIGRITGVYPFSPLMGQVTPITGSPVIWSQPDPQSPTEFINPILLSPNGSLIAFCSTGISPTAVTDIWKNGKLVAAVPGVGVGWIDNNRILVDQYVQANGPEPIIQFSKSVIFSAAGVQLATPHLPELTNFQSVTSDSIYAPNMNAIYSVTTGKMIWNGTFVSSGVGAVTGPYVLYESGHRLVYESY